MISGRQIRAARGLLDMSQEELAKSAGLTPQAIRKIEDGTVQPREGSMADITRVFHERGAEFIDNQGVRLKPNSIEVFVGSEGFADFFDIVYNHLRQFGGEVCVSGVDEALFSKYRPNAELHRGRMAELAKMRKDFSMHILVKDGDYNFSASSYASYKWSPQEDFTPTAFYVFGDMLALITFSHEPPPYVVLIKSAAFADAYRRAFNLSWHAAKDIPPRVAP